jgi:hypothetical protein
VGGGGGGEDVKEEKGPAAKRPPKIDRDAVALETAGALEDLDKDEVIELVAEFATLARRDSEVLMLKELAEEKQKERAREKQREQKEGAKRAWGELRKKTGEAEKNLQAVAAAVVDGTAGFEDAGGEAGGGAGADESVEMF